ncbi:MAG TPA: hypothetical protein VFS72_08505 [Agromyces sp.]|nr:hypothetical protein [Agromyces sp.]
MSNAERIAELQRIAYGAGATDVERATASAQLDALRRAASRVAGESAPPRPDVKPGSPSSDDPGTRAPDPLEALLAEEWPVVAVPDRPPSAALRSSVLAGVIALAVGFGAGWVSGSQTASELGGSSASDRDVTFEVAVADEDRAPVPFDQAPAMAVFERPQVPEDLPSFTDPSLDAMSHRRLVTLPDGAAVHAARSPDGAQVCLLLDLPPVGGGSSCTSDGAFPAGGMQSETSFDGRSAYVVNWAASGEVSVTVSPED